MPSGTTCLALSLELDLRSAWSAHGWRETAVYCHGCRSSAQAGARWLPGKELVHVPLKEKCHVLQELSMQTSEAM